MGDGFSCQANLMEKESDLLAEVVRTEGDRWLETLHRLVPVGRISPELCSAIEARLASSTRAV